MKKFFLVLLVLTIIAMAAGCSDPVKNPTMPTEIPNSFSTTGTEPLPDNFWQAFEDDQLDTLIDQALANNFNLETAWDRLAQAQAVAKKSEAALWPQAELDAGFRRSRQENQDIITYSSLYSLGIAAGYEVDLWSRLKSSQKAAWLDVQAQRDAVNTAAITVTASITNTWYQLAEVKALIQIAAEQIETNRQVLEIVTVKFRKGAASAADVLRQRQLVASTEALLIVVEEAEELLQYQLSVLVGNQPELTWQKTSIALPDLPPMPSLGVPADVLCADPMSGGTSGSCRLRINVLPPLLRNSTHVSALQRAWIHRPCRCMIYSMTGWPIWPPMPSSRSSTGTGGKRKCSANRPLSRNASTSGAKRFWMLYGTSKRL